MTRGLRTFMAACLVGLLPGAAGATRQFLVGGPAENDVDGGVRRVRLNSVNSGLLKLIVVNVQLSREFPDQLSLFISHAGQEVQLFRGEGNTPETQFSLNFSDDATVDYNPVGPNTGLVRPAPGTLNTFLDQDAGGVWELRIEDPTGTVDGTDLFAWSIFVEVDFETPPVPVALFFDGGFVDTTPSGGFFADAEAENLRALIESFGHPVALIEGTSADAFANALATAQVLVIPELESSRNNEGADLAGALSAAARDEIRNFVAGGGTFITCGNLWGNNTALVNAIFGYATATVSPGDSVLRDETIGTPFQHVAGSLASFTLELVTGLGNPPADAIPIHTGLNVAGSVDLVTSIPYPPGGDGQVIWLGNDFYHARPNGTSDGGWVEILNRAIVNDVAAFVPPRRAAVFDDPAFVDTGGGADSESDNVQGSLSALGHAVAPFSGTATGDFTAALDEADVLVIPELEIDPDLVGALEPGATAAIQSFVNAGGVLITMAGANLDFVNQVFGYELEIVEDGGSGFFPSWQGSAAGTSFAEAVNTLDANSPVDAVTLDSLPINGVTIYRVPGGPVVVAMFRIGLGRLIWYGWDWSNGFPNGEQNGGWVDNLGRGLLEAAAPGTLITAPEPGPAFVSLVTLATLLGYCRYRSAA